jgi:hypothetical protein
MSFKRSYYLKGAAAACLLLAQSDAWSVAPAPMQNYCPIVIVNRTTLPANTIYFVAHGNDSNGIPCFLVPDMDGICQIAYPTPSGTPSSAGSSVTLSELPTATGTGISDAAYLIYLPVDSASRGYFSLNSPMYLATSLNPALGVLGISDSSVTSLSDPNFYTFYQDFEFGLVNSNVANSKTTMFINLSWVDYFCLPMQLYAQEYPSNTQISVQYSALASGTPSDQTRDQMVTAFKNSMSSFTSTWGTLNIPYYNNPYTDTVPVTQLRILAAKNSIGLGASNNNFQGAKVTQGYFPTSYITSSSSGPQSNTSYLTAVYNYYHTPNTFYATIHPAGNPAVVYTITAAPTSLILELTGASGAPSYTLNLNNLTTEQLLSGANSGAPWPYTLTAGTDSAAYTNELSKLFSALFTIGQLPFTAYATSMGSPFDNSQYNSAMDPGGYSTLSYFSNPPTFTLNGPWYNLYDLNLHQLLISKGDVPVGHNPTLGLGYGYDYDDLLNLAGLMAIDIQDLYGNPSQTTGEIEPYIVISLESLSGTTIPDISQDSYSYPVTVNAAPNGVTVAFIHYNGTSTVTTPASLTVPVSLGTVVVDGTHPFQVSFTFNSVIYLYNINLQRQIVLPSSLTSTYTSADEHFQGSFTFTVSGPQGSPSFVLAYNSTPPPWPG